MPDEVIRAVNSLVPISDFNKGKANKIFENIQDNGYKLVVKNNKPVCVLITPKRYEEMIRIIEEKNVSPKGDKSTDEKPFEERKREFFYSANSESGFIKAKRNVID